MNTFCSRLKSLRTSKRKYQKDMALFLGISLQLYESGDGYPSVPGLISLANYFNVSLDYLVGRSDDPTRH